MLKNFRKVTATIAVIVILLQSATSKNMHTQSPSNISTHLYDAQSDPRLFKLRTMFEGNWRSADRSIRQFGEYAVDTGYARCLFVTMMPKTTKFLYIELAEGVDSIVYPDVFRQS